ncbi:MAG: hypothetical protein IJW82_07675, partial [Clostridia bacterium]|nr:hypothetical protein [Clostridia bacterium]
MRRRKKMIKLIVSISAISLAAILLVTTIVLAVVKKDFKVNLTEPNQIRIYDTASGNFYGHTYDKDKDEYKKIMELLNKSYSQS